jgi:hypothetical protein
LNRHSRKASRIHIALFQCDFMARSESFNQRQVASPELAAEKVSKRI